MCASHLLAARTATSSALHKHNLSFLIREKGWGGVVVPLSFLVVFQLLYVVSLLFPPFSLLLNRFFLVCKFSALFVWTEGSVMLGVDIVLKKRDGQCVISSRLVINDTLFMLSLLLSMAELALLSSLLLQAWILTVGIYR